MAKFTDYFKQNDFDEYLRRSNLLNEELIRSNLIASDFEMTGVFHIDYFFKIMTFVFLTKMILFVGLGKKRKSFFVKTPLCATEM